MSAPEADQEPENFDDLSDPVDVLNSDDVEVEVVDDVPEKDQNRPARAETSEADESDDDEEEEQTDDPIDDPIILVYPPPEEITLPEEISCDEECDKDDLTY